MHAAAVLLDNTLGIINPTCTLLAVRGLGCFRQSRNVWHGFDHDHDY